MSDSLSFDTRFTATGNDGTSTVDGPQVDMPGPSRTRQVCCTGAPSCFRPPAGR